jgi:hypothetical protein
MTKTIRLSKKASKLARIPSELVTEINKIIKIVDIEFKKKHNINYKPTNTQALRIYVTANKCSDKYLKITHKGKSILLEKR